MTTHSEPDPSNWVDPDIISYNEAHGGAASYDLPREIEFRTFFEAGWQDTRYDELRERWDPLINDEDAHGRVLAKTALWNLIKLREIQKHVSRVLQQPISEEVES